jgi:homoserine kinase
MKAVTLRVPATSANLGSAFDTAGIAFDLYNTFSFEKADALSFEGFEPRFCNENNLAYIAYKAVCDKIGVPSGVKIAQISIEVPVSRGLGSSATLTAAGAVAANVLHGKPLSDMVILAVCTEIEGHPDNAAPALFGGLCVSLTDEGVPFSVCHKVSEDVCFTAVYPNFEVATKDARAVLPKEIDRHDAIFNLSRAALLPYAFEKGDFSLLKAVTKDKLHEPYRKKLFRNIAEIEKAAYDAGAVSFIISGAGSTCLCISKEPIAEKLNKMIARLENGWTAHALRVDTDGATVTEEA